MAKACTDAARATDVIKNWLRARSTLEFLGTWEMMYNPDFKGGVAKSSVQMMVRCLRSMIHKNPGRITVFMVPAWIFCVL